MRRQLLPANERASDNTLARLALTLAGISVIGLGLLGWMASHPETLPPPDSAAGRSLQRSYLRISHQIWFVLLALAVGNLIRCISNSEPEQAPKEPKRSTLASVSRFIRNTPPVDDPRCCLHHRHGRGHNLSVCRHDRLVSGSD